MLSKEERLIQEYEEILNSEDDLSNRRKEFEKLLKEYKKSYKQLNKIIKISDKQQDELKYLSDNLNAKSHKVKSLLDNADQGFLSFGYDFVIDEEYSRECEKLLGLNLAGKDIADILYPDDIKNNNFLKEALTNVIDEEDDMIKDVMLSLLPKEVILNKRAIKLDYKILTNQKYMIVLTNITKERILEKKIAQEQEILKMIVTIVSQPMQFYDLKDDFQTYATNKNAFINRNLPFEVNLSEVYRDIHTFKGSFAQIRMQNSVKELHNLETKLSSFSQDSIHTNQDLIELLNKSDMIKWMEKDLLIIKKILGAEFFDKQHKLEVDDKFIFTIEDKITHLLNTDNQHMNTYEEILSELNRARGTTINQALSIYPKLCKEIAKTIEKDIYDFKIIGGDEVVIPLHFKPFIKSLVHVFRNAIDHGIEDMETRLKSSKDECGSITCKIEDFNEYIKIIISDDGAGIDTNRLKEKALQANIYTQEQLSSMSEKEILNLIFFESLSTNDTVNELSGRGIGLNAVKVEVEKLSGSIDTQSTLGKGTTFNINIPTSIYGNLINIASNNQDNITIEYILAPVVNRVSTYLQSDMKINLNEKAKFSYTTVDAIKLKSYCAYIHISGLVDVSVCMSYDLFILDKLLEEFNGGHPIHEDEIVDYRESISKEVLNIVIGNALFNPYDKSVLEITTPIIVNYDELYSHGLNQKIAHVIIDTEYGEIQILVGRF